MGYLTPYVDPTGTMTPSEVTQANIEQIMEELNRNNDSLDTLTSAMSIAAYGSHTTNAVTLPGNSNDSSNQFSFTHNLGYIPAYLCYIPGTPNAAQGFPASIYIALVNTFQVFVGNITYTWNVGVDNSKFYVTCELINNISSSQQSLPQTLYYYILSNPASGTNT